MKKTLLASALILGFSFSSAFAKENVDFNTLLQQANSGDQIALYKVGVMYSKGEGTTKNLDKAMEYLEKATKGSSTKYVGKSQHEIAFIYEEKGDKEKAKEFFLKACDNGVRTSCEFYKELDGDKK